MNDAQVMAALEHDEEYRVVRSLASKSTGTTELVYGKGPELLVRKRIPSGLANEGAWRTVADINSPLLPKVHDIYWLPDELVVVTAYVDGVTVYELVERTGPVDQKQAVSYICELCRAVGTLHAHGVVHRDITPSNVVISGGSARLIDLGCAREYVEGARHDTTALGTLGFAAPEQFGFAQSDARSDVYALGSLLGYLLTGAQPGDKAFDEALADEERVPFVLRIVIERARSFEPSARYGSTGEFSAAVRAAIGERSEVRAAAAAAAVAAEERAEARMAQSTVAEGRPASRPTDIPVPVAMQEVPTQPDVVLPPTKQLTTPVPSPQRSTTSGGADSTVKSIPLPPEGAPLADGGTKDAGTKAKRKKSGRTKAKQDADQQKREKKAAEERQSASDDALVHVDRQQIKRFVTTWPQLSSHEKTRVVFSWLICLYAARMFLEGFLDGLYYWNTEDWLVSLVGIVCSLLCAFNVHANSCNALLDPDDWRSAPTIFLDWTKRFFIWMLIALLISGIFF